MAGDATTGAGSGAQAEGPRVLAAAECWALLGARSVGRIGVVVSGYPVVVPLNYAVDHGNLVVRTGGGEVHAAAQHANVTFQVDELDERGHGGWSVLVRALAEEVGEDHTADVVRRTLESGVQPWAPGERDHWLRLVVHGVTGRQVVPTQLDDGGTAGYL
ncbi:pyridoxamine 5'-phosphate oxidase family protein [Quadrisphaera setariae]|uniref:Pyridoxamine 5'-phosphate oxidase family protein n=1 Tax=Quadrisphaera setariae TaxID=2593304 RepID=A0A5C8ZLI0_9ACTN|nr:pyridoxamine 5'-phosphate oxidase family protein [Quadrisphaera setariae]TXR58023.1 pyridoxamine 5'-phosphate oxidase family protein [Quadrisphaera setariae]